jgi:hypothetical protein
MFFPPLINSFSLFSQLTSDNMASRGELSGEDQPPTYRQASVGSGSGGGGGGGIRTRSYRSLPVEELELQQQEPLALTCLQLTLRFLMTHKAAVIIGLNVLVLLVGLTTLSMTAALAHGRGFAPPPPPPPCGDNDTSCISDMFDQDYDAVALYELSRENLFRTIGRAVRVAFLRPEKGGNVSLAQELSENLKEVFFNGVKDGEDTSSLFQLLVRDLTAHLESKQHPESGK